MASIKRAAIAVAAILVREGQAYVQGGRTGLMLPTLLETGARASELVQLPGRRRPPLGHRIA